MKARLGKISQLIAACTVLQVFLSAGLCLNMSAQAADLNQISICTPEGIKTISLDENGEPVEQKQEHSNGSCAHCQTHCQTMDCLSSSHVSLTLAPLSEKNIRLWQPTNPNVIVPYTVQSRAPPLLGTSYIL